MSLIAAKCFLNNFQDSATFIWSNFPKLINLYKYFDGPNKKEIIKKYFIDGDVHWNKNGHLLIAESVEKEMLRNF